MCIDMFSSAKANLKQGIWMAAANSWVNLLIARFALGLAVGAKSSTTPVYSAECAPTAIRGALTMMWQMWTAFGIMLGFVVSVAFENVRYTEGQFPYWNWRLMLASTSIPPFFVCMQVYLVPESPRWYMTKNKYRKAYDALCRFRNCEMMAARDVYYIHKSLMIEEKLREGKNLWKEFFMVPRNRRAAQSSFFVMFMQQVRQFFALFRLAPTNHEIVLRSQRHRLLLDRDLHLRKFLTFQCPAGVTWNGCRKLALYVPLTQNRSFQKLVLIDHSRHPSRQDDRHIRTEELASHYLSFDGYLSSLHRI